MSGVAGRFSGRRAAAVLIGAVLIVGALAAQTFDNGFAFSIPPFSTPESRFWPGLDTGLIESGFVAADGAGRFRITLDQHEVPSLWFGVELLHVPRPTTGRR